MCRIDFNMSLRTTTPDFVVGVYKGPLSGEGLATLLLAINWTRDNLNIDREHSYTCGYNVPLAHVRPRISPYPFTTCGTVCVALPRHCWEHA